MEDLGLSGSGGTGRAVHTPCETAGRLLLLHSGKQRSASAGYACPICLSGAAPLHEEALNRLALQRLRADLLATLADRT